MKNARSLLKIKEDIETAGMKMHIPKLGTLKAEALALSFHL